MRERILSKLRVYLLLQEVKYLMQAIDPKLIYD